MYDLQSEEAIQYLREYDITMSKIKNMLERLGYPRSFGRKLYAEWIYEIMNDIKVVQTRDDIRACKEYLLDMNEGVSPYYHDLVREGMWMGIKPFHAAIEDMVDKIDYEASDKDLLSKIYGNINYSINYAQNAFLLAAYMLGFKKEEEQEIKHGVMIKKLDYFKDGSLDYFR